MRKHNLIHYKELRLCKTDPIYAGKLERAVKRLRIWLYFGVIFAATSCFPDTYTGLQDHEKLMADAQNAEMAGDYLTAEKKLDLAIDVARKIDWDEGVITAKMRMAGIFVSQKRYSEAEQNFSEARSLCVQISCYGLVTIFDQSIFFHLFQAKNPQKALALAKELLDDPSKYANQEARREKASEYAAEMKMAGFPDISQQIIENYLK